MVINRKKEAELAEVSPETAKGFEGFECVMSDEKANGRIWRGT